MALVVAACAPADDVAGQHTDAASDAVRTSAAEPQPPPEMTESSPVEDVPSALDDPTAEGLPEPLVDLDRISALLPPDGIPAVDDPLFLSPAEVDFLGDQEPVLAIEVDGDARAYPIQIMTWHEIVNDTIGGRPITVSFCPLCNSAIAYERTVGGRILDFGTSGSLFQSALVMYDRQTESLWSHFTAEAIAGHLTGAQLDTIPVATVSWAAWRDANPDGLVLSRETGHDRDYGRNPYVGYDDINSSPFGFDGEIDGRLPAMARVVALGDGDTAAAVKLEDLRDERVFSLELDGREVVVWHQPGTASSLDSGSIAAGDDIGATGVFEPTLDGRPLTFTAEGDRFVDEQTGSTWNILGEAVDGPAAGAKLDRVEHVDTFWFAWAAFQPDTEILP